MNQRVINPNDYKVVAFHNLTDFDFTPQMGCMYDGREISGRSGAPGIQAGETVMLPYHVAHQLATNLAKRVLNTSPAATVDPSGIPTGVPIWDKDRLQREKNRFLEELYTEEKPVAQTQTDILMAKVDQYQKLVEQLLAKDSSTRTEQEAKIVEAITPTVAEPAAEPGQGAPKTYADKQEVIAELEKRGIPHNKRAAKATLEKLLV